MENQIEHKLSPQEVLFNPINNSTSKFQFSFSKAERFLSDSSTKSKTIKTEEQITHFYDLPSTISKKAASFGIGEKGSGFKVTSQAPPATKYSPMLLDDFEHYAKKSSKNKGFSFSTGRENIKSFSFIPKNENPGPGNYNPNPQKVMDRSFSGFSMTKNERFSHLKQKSKTAFDKIIVPGPGSYQIKSTIGGHNKILSQDKNINPCPRLTLSKNESRKIQAELQRKIYNPQLTRVGDSTNFDKKKGFTVGRSLRSDFVKNKGVPGPGNYRIFSEFIHSEK